MRITGVGSGLVILTLLTTYARGRPMHSLHSDSVVPERLSEEDANLIKLDRAVRPDVTHIFSTHLAIEPYLNMETQPHLFAVRHGHKDDLCPGAQVYACR